MQQYLHKKKAKDIKVGDNLLINGSLAYVDDYFSLPNSDIIIYVTLKEVKTDPNTYLEEIKIENNHRIDLKNSDSVFYLLDTPF